MSDIQINLNEKKQKNIDLMENKYSEVTSYSNEFVQDRLKKVDNIKSLSVIKRIQFGLTPETELEIEKPDYTKAELKKMGHFEKKRKTKQRTNENIEIRKRNTAIVENEEKTVKNVQSVNEIAYEMFQDPVFKDISGGSAPSPDEFTGGEDDVTVNEQLEKILQNPQKYGVSDDNKNGLTLKAFKELNEFRKEIRYQKWQASLASYADEYFEQKIAEDGANKEKYLEQQQKFSTFVENFEERMATAYEAFTVAYSSMINHKDFVAIKEDGFKRKESDETTKVMSIREAYNVYRDDALNMAKYDKLCEQDEFNIELNLKKEIESHREAIKKAFKNEKDFIKFLDLSDKKSMTLETARKAHVIFKQYPAPDTKDEKLLAAYNQIKRNFFNKANIIDNDIHAIVLDKIINSQEEYKDKEASSFNKKLYTLKEDYNKLALDKENALKEYVKKLSLLSAGVMIDITKPVSDEDLKKIMN